MIAPDKLEEEFARALASYFAKHTGFSTMGDEGVVEACYGGHWIALNTRELAQACAVIARKQVEELEAALAEKPTDPAEMVGVAEAVAFYADPENWHGVYMVGGGRMADDWGDVEDAEYPDGKPGKRAREAIDAYLESRRRSPSQRG